MVVSLCPTEIVLSTTTLKLFRETLMRLKTRGFTLIELLVVISIISLLASVVLAALNNARTKAQDAQRIQDLGQLHNALALYYDDHGAYPIMTGSIWAEMSSADEKWNTDENPLYVALVMGTPQYIPVLPTDPKNGPGDMSWHLEGYVYTYSTYSAPGSPALGSDYDLTVQLETGHSLACPNRQLPMHTYPSDDWCNYPLGIDGGTPENRRIFSDH